MTKLSNIKDLGRFEHIETGKQYNLKKGRNLQRGIDLIFYLFRGKRQILTDMEFYNKYKKV